MLSKKGTALLLLPFLSPEEMVGARNEQVEAPLGDYDGLAIPILARGTRVESNLTLHIVWS